MREAFERAILDDPDQVAGYAAYADWLQEQGDPRGEFIAVQLALEDESRSTAERKKLQAREAELRKEHERDWLGELAPHIFDRVIGDPSDADYDWNQPARPRVEHQWRRGFLSDLDVQCLTVGLAQALATAPAARLLREMRVHSSDEYYSMTPDPDGRTPRVPTPPGVRNHYGHFELIGASCLESLRVFRAGGDDDEPPEDGWVRSCSCHLPGLTHLIAGMSRIEELHLLCNDYSLDVYAMPNLTRLRVLRVYHVGSRGWEDHRYEYPLDVLAANSAFANLTHLQFHPHFPEGANPETGSESYIPLDQVRALLRSSHLGKLTHLQLRLSDMGDDGVREFVNSGILKRLKWLDLRHGCITDEGAKLFAACPDARNLERLDLSRNGVTASGLKLLRDASVNAIANSPLTEQELEEREYLREGDFE